MADTFRIVPPTRRGDGLDVVRVPFHTYDNLAALKKETGMSVCRIVEQCVAFALERLERDTQNQPGGAALSGAQASKGETTADMTANGVTAAKTPGPERHETFYRVSGDQAKKYFSYIFRRADGELIRCIKPPFTTHPAARDAGSKRKAVKHKAVNRMAR